MYRLKIRQKITVNIWLNFMTINNINYLLLAENLDQYLIFLSHYLSLFLFYFHLVSIVVFELLKSKKKKTTKLQTIESLWKLCATINFTSWWSLWPLKYDDVGLSKIQSCIMVSRIEAPSSITLTDVHETKFKHRS